MKTQKAIKPDAHLFPLTLIRNQMIPSIALSPLSLLLFFIVLSPSHLPSLLYLFSYTVLYSLSLL